MPLLTTDWPGLPQGKRYRTRFGLLSTLTGLCRSLFIRRRLTVAYVIILTDKELIFISDDSSAGDRGRYGVVRRSIPLVRIKA